ncbi:hypothetical protein F5Y05DRAFT_287057 [Hypoxylon sp. FL0543]|nr:hypothetical protein F5Y05DRAFT_287057 [Hypoxylon sp. FL0543]
MKPLLPLIFSLSTLHGANAHEGAVDTALVARDHQPDSQTMASYEKQGLCMYYYTSRQPNWDKGIQPCIKYCANNGGHGYSECDMSSYAGVDLEKDTSMPKYVDDDGYPWIPAPCKCENKAVEYLAGEIINIVAEALSMLDNILCAVFVSAIKEIADIGLMFVPGGQAIKGADKVIQYAKSGYENGMDAAGFYTDWVGKACGVPGWSFSLEDAFIGMVNAPDSMMGKGVSSTGCLLKKNKSQCRKRDPKPDPKTSSQIVKGTSTKKADPPKTNDPTKKTSNPAKTTSNPPKTTESAKACKVKRAAYNPPDKRLVKKFGDVEERIEEECNNGKTTTTHHVTTTEKDIGYYVQDRKSIPKVVCKKEHTQACYHYRSVMSRYAKTPSMTEWTCQATATSWSSAKSKGWGKDGLATEKWGSTALAKIPGTSGRAAKISWQHWFPWANGYVYRENVMENGKVKVDAKGNEVFKGCDRDEFPPRYFWPGDDKAPKDMRQWVRFVPEDQNRGAGQLWGGFCNDHNAASTTKPPNKPEETYVVSANLKSDKPKISKEQPKGKDLTIHSTVKVSTLRAIFSISEFEGLKANDDGLADNPCYPKALIDDPGWALLTDDAWYDDHPQSKANVGSYRKAPTKAMVDAAKAKVDAAKKAGEKLDTMEAVDLKAMMKRVGSKDEKDMWNKWVGTGEGQIPEELWGLLPTIPKFPKPKRRSFSDIAAANETLSLEDRDSDDLDWDGHEDHVDDMDDEELRRWLEEYEEIMRRMYDDEVESPTTPPEVPAEPTFVPRNERDIVDQPPAAVAGSTATDMMPQPTTI